MSKEIPQMSDGEIDMQPLISKLGHAVDEIRVRSLKNIIFKLDHDLIGIEDVVHKKEMFVKLLEWFNSNPCSHHREVLELLEKLSTHSSAVETLVGIGGVEFFSHLRRDVDPSLYQIIDNILSNLLSLPGDISDGDGECQWLHYESGKKAIVLVPENSGDVQLVTPPGQTHGTSHSDEICNSRQTPLHNKIFTEQQLPFNQEQFFENQLLKCEDQCWHVEEVDKEGTASSWHFPWVRLAESDRGILSTTNTRLKSHNPNLVKKSCEFLNDVLFKDFPAEIFLQRPSIVKTLLTVLEIKYVDNNTLSLSAASCLSGLCNLLRQRYLIISDPSWYSLQPDCWKHWFGHGSSSSSGAASPVSVTSDLRTSGDGGQMSSDSSNTASDHYVEVEEEDGLIREALEMNQMSLEEFSLQVLRGVCPLLNSVGDPLTLLAALQDVLKLLEVCCPSYQWWNNNKMVHKPLRQDICRIVAKTLNSHMLRCGLKRCEGQDIVEHNMSRHAMSVVNLSLWIINFLGPYLQAEWVDDGISQALRETFLDLIMNEILFATHPEIRLCLERCPLVKGDIEFLGLYNKTLSIKRSFVASVEFLRNVRSKRDVCQDALIQTLSSSLLSLPYHHRLDLVTHSFTLISSVFERGCVGEEMKTRTKDVLLSLMSNLDDVVRRTSYECCVEVVKGALKYSHVTNPMSSYYMKAMFVVDRDVLHVICAFGMTDQCEEISNLATKILETLLENRLNMSSRLWKKLLDDILTSLPYLQTHLGKRSKLATCLMGLLAPPGESPHCLTAEGEVIPFSEFERLRGSLRCMFHRDKMVRAKGYGYLIRRLVDEDSRLKRDFVYPSGKLENSADLFILDTFASSVRSHRSTKHAGFDDERIRKLFNIVATETTEVSLRKSSAEQLTLLMEDPDWHETLLHELAEDTLLRVLDESLVRDGKVHLSLIVNPKLELVSPCLKIVRLLSEYNVRCRRKLSQMSSVYRLVSRHALLAPSGGTVRYESACLLTLLLFDEVAQSPSFEEREKNGTCDAMFALPALVLKRYMLPFNPPIYELSNPYQGERPSEEDPLRSEPVLSQLRVAWNLAWSDDQNGISVDGPDGSRESTNDELRMLPLDAQLLKSYSAKAAIPEAITAIITATSHYAVKLSISKLSMHFLVENAMKRCQRADGESSRALAREVFYSCDWKTAFERYFTVYPKSADDDRLLCEVLRMFRYLIQETFPPPLVSFLGWLARVIMSPDSTVSVLLSTPSPSRELLDVSVSETKRALRKELLEFLSVFVAKLRGVSKPWLWSGEMVYAGDFTLGLTLNLNLTDSPQYYDLPILESTLQCLVEVTAIPGFSAVSKLVEPKALCVELLTSLVQVFTAFRAGRLGAFTSFMGRGVTMCVSLSLVHLVHEMSSILKLQDWSTFFPTITNKESISEVSWLTAMWTDNLPEVRWSSLAIATHIVNHSGSPLSIKQNIAGGMWNLAVIILLDGKECCLVREQAVLLLSTLLSTLKREDLDEPDTGLSVQTEHEIINGIPALHLLLAHHHFYSSFREMLRNVVFDNSQLPRTTTFADSLSSSSSRSKYGIPYQSLDTDSNSGGVPRSSESTKMTSSSSSSSRSRESTRRLLAESPATSNSGPAVSSGTTSRASSTVPLITRSRTESESAREDVPSSASRVDSLEMLAWVTPRFVGSLCGMLTNLVCVAPDTVLNEVKEEDILGLILGHLDGKHAISLIHQLNNRQSRSQQRHLEMSLIDTLYMYTEIAQLLKTCCAKDPLVAHALQQNTMILEKLLDLLTITITITSSKLGDTVGTACHKMWSSVVDLLLMSMKTVKESRLLETQFEQLLLKRWAVFAVAFKHVMHTSEAHLRTSFLHLLLHLLLREGKRVTTEGKANQGLTEILDKNHETREENSTSKVIQNGVNSDILQGDLKMTTENDKQDEFSGNGSELCSILLFAYDENNFQDKTRHNDDERNYVISALKNLFCISRAAKVTAVKSGFHVSSIDKIKQLHVTLNMESLEVGKGTGTRQKEMDLVNEMVKILELLKNLAFRCNETKLEAINHGIMSMLQQLWSWCTVVKTLRLSVLELLCTLTARCSQASITMSNTLATTASSVRLAPSNNTFVHCVIKMATKMMNKSLNNSTGDGNLASCQILFSLLKNIAMTSECRGILWKSNFISEFSRLKSHNHQKWKLGQKTVVSLWLELLANIAFYRDGQQMIVKIDNIVPLLLEFTSSSTKRVSESALLIVRNLCFHVPSKTLLLSNGEVVELLLRSVDKPLVYVRSLATSALWALLTNNQKGKSILGKPALVQLVVKRLSDSKHTLKPTLQGSNTSEQVQRQYYENALENILKILRI